MSSESMGRRVAPRDPTQPRSVVTAAPDADVAPEVLEFIRYCYHRRGFGWPELYDEMCAVAARGRYRGMDYDALARLGIGFSLSELPRLAALSGRVVAEERATRQPGAGREATRREDLRRDDGSGATTLLVSPVT